MRGVTVKVDLTDKLLKSLAALTKDRCLVGVPASNADRDPEPGESPDVNNAMIGYIMETGSPAKNIPARPFLVPGVENAKDEVAKRYAAGAKAMLNGKTDTLEPTHNAVGLIAVASVQEKITDGPFVPLAPRTLAARRARGRTGEMPLIDTDQLRRAQNYVIRRKGD